MAGGSPYGITEFMFTLCLAQTSKSSKALLFDGDLHQIACAEREVTQIYPQPGWVEVDAMELWASTRATMAEVLARSNVKTEAIFGLAITNQRETFVVWDRSNGRPIHNAITWECMRAVEVCDRLQPTLGGHVRDTTGLRLDPHFPGPKLAALLDAVEGARHRADLGQLLFGTVDTWLLWKLTDGQVHATDFTNASRTMMLNIHDMTWDDHVLAALGVPRGMLPSIHASASVFGHANLGGAGGLVPIASVVGDQQAALFGHECTQPGQLKNTFSRGSFLLMNTGKDAVHSTHGLLTTIVCDADGGPCYGLEGIVLTAGGAVQWLKEGLGIVQSEEEVYEVAATVESAEGVYVVPALSGMGAPHWVSQARGTVVGLTRGSNRAHVARATLEGIAFQTMDVVDALRADTGLPLSEIAVDCIEEESAVLLRFQADILNAKIIHRRGASIAAQGAAALAAKTLKWNPNRGTPEFTAYVPTITAKRRSDLQNGWRRAVRCARSWADDE
ncbi:MAG: hypothetical protein KVP17_004862 [Porospora cf. gigantea B]|uniref:uncharacterized protein n=2 Tax=Porospora cf. gigantea B TaxID=2853592 RepID=UPI003571C9A9|nr:MAG: hypothetical protein KVP17_004862 [Porospora cf. gigantea B]